jgi:hypothetical protein
MFLILCLYRLRVLYLLSCFLDWCFFRECDFFLPPTGSYDNQQYAATVMQAGMNRIVRSGKYTSLNLSNKNKISSEPP